MSTGETDADVKITLTADDQASSTVDSATAQINASFRTMTQTQNAMGRSYLVNNQSVFALGRAMQSTGRIVDRSLALFNSYNLMQLRISSTAQTAIDAQENLAQVIAQYGANSIQAQTAADQLQKAQAAATKASQDAAVQFALMTASMVAQSGTMIVTVIPRLIALRDTLAAVGIASGVNAAVGTAAAGGVGAGTLTGGVGAALSRGAGVAAKFVGPAAVGVSLLSMMGQQQAGGGEAGPGLPGGIQQLQNIFNIIVQDAGAAASQVQQELSKVLSFSGQSP